MILIQSALPPRVIFKREREKKKKTLSLPRLSDFLGIDGGLGGLGCVPAAFVSRAPSLERLGLLDAARIRALQFPDWPGRGAAQRLGLCAKGNGDRERRGQISQLHGAGGRTFLGTGLSAADE